MSAEAQEWYINLFKELFNSRSGRISAVPTG